MCVKRRAGGLSLERGLFFWTRSSSPAWECRSIWPPSYPTYSTLPPSPLPPLCCLENGSSTFETQPVAFWGLTFTKWAYSLNTFHRSWYSSSCLHGTLNTMTAYIQRCWFGTALTSPFVSNVIAVVTGVMSFCQLCKVALLTNNGKEISPFPASTMLHRCTVCGLCGCGRACACQAIWHLHLKSPSFEILTTLLYIALQSDGQKYTSTLSKGTAEIYLWLTGDINGSRDMYSSLWSPCQLPECLVLRLALYQLNSFYILQYMW